MTPTPALPDLFNDLRRGRTGVASLLPAPLARGLIEGHTRAGDRLLDPRSGGGAVGAEAVRLGRDFVGVEPDPSLIREQLRRLARARDAGAPGAFALWRADLLRPGRGLSDPTAAVERMGPFDAAVTSLDVSAAPDECHPRNGETQLRTEGRGSPAGPRLLLACVFAALRPGGTLALAVRPAGARGRSLPLHHACAFLCLELGFERLGELAVLGDGGGARPEAGFPAAVVPAGCLLLFRKPLRDRVNRPVVPVRGVSRRTVHEKGGPEAAP